MRFKGIYINNGEFEERNVGFHSRNVIFYSATNDPEITCVVLAKDGIKEFVYVACAVSDFYLEKKRSEQEDLNLLPVCFN